MQLFCRGESETLSRAIVDKHYDLSYTQLILCVSIYLCGHKEWEAGIWALSCPHRKNHLTYRLTESKTQQQLYLLQFLNTQNILVAGWKLTAV